MAEQVSTPGSAADSSNTGSAPAQCSTTKTPAGNPSAPKDKQCPFCGQPFTSSSLGRHLDLYIKEKNPKPADGLHDVDEIRKMRGAITRRQPRGGGRREGSQGTPSGTPAVSRRDSGLMGDDENRSPSVVSRHQPVFDKGKTTTQLNQANWQSTGVINNIPIMHQRNELNGMGGNTPAPEGGQIMETPTHGKRTVSRQMLAKSTFDSKQKVIEAMEGQRAAELALRELLGSIKAAITVAQPPLATNPFDFDPLSLDFPALVLTCLPPPPTLASTPLPSPSSWALDPPNNTQFEALNTFFRERFHAASITRAMTTSHPPNADDLLYAHHAAPEMAASVAAHAKQFEDQVLMHVSEAYKYWTRLPPSNRDHCWKLEMARNVGGKTQKIQQLENMLRGVQQENAHLKCQIESLSKLQAPREYAMSRPETIKIGPQEASKLAGMGLREQSMGWKMGRVEESLEERVRNAVERWRGVVKASRRSGLPGQRSLSQGQQSMESGMMQQNHGDEEESMDVDADADADADAEADEDNNVAVQYTFKPEMPTPNPNSQQMQQQAQQQQQHAQQQQQVPQHAQHNRGHEVNQQQQQQQQQAHMITGVNYGQANMHQQRHNANQQHVAMNGLGIGVASVGLMHQNYPQHAQQQQQAMSHQGQGMEGGQVSINGRSMSSGMSQPMAQMSMGRGGMGMQQQQQGQVGQMNGRGARNGF